jgi:hypothetical protein
MVSDSIGAAGGTTTGVVGMASSVAAVAGSELPGRTAVAAGISALRSTVDMLASAVPLRPGRLYGPPVTLCERLIWIGC